MLETIFDDIRLLGTVGLSFQVPPVGGGEDDMASAIFTVATISDMRAKSLTGLVVGQTIGFCDQNFGEYRLIPNSGFPDDGANILSSTNASYQWLKV